MISGDLASAIAVSVLEENDRNLLYFEIWNCQLEFVVTAVNNIYISGTMEVLWRSLRSPLNFLRYHIEHQTLDNSISKSYDLIPFHNHIKSSTLSMSALRPCVKDPLEQRLKSSQHNNNFVNLRRSQMRKKVKARMKMTRSTLKWLMLFLMPSTSTKKKNPKAWSFSFCFCCPIKTHHHSVVTKI